MRKKLITLCLAALCVLGAQAKKVYADLSKVKAAGANGTWDASSNKFSWTNNNDARVLLTDLTGDLSEYTSLVLETSEYQNQSWRVDFVADGKTFNNKTGTVFYSAGTKTINLQTVFADNTDKLKKVTEVRVNTNSSEKGSIVINKAYLVKPLTSLEFNKEGIATVDFTDIEASKATFDETTGEVKSSTTSGSLSLNLPATGVDMSNVARIMVEYDGEDITDYLVMNNASNEQIAKPYPSRHNLLFTDYQTKASHVAKMSWNICKSGTMTIKAIKFYSKTFGEKYTLTVTDAGASTLVLPYEVKIPDGVKVYTLTYTSGTNVNATTLTGTIPANTPVLINAVAGDYEFTRTEGTDVPTLGSDVKTSGALNGQYMSWFTAPKDSYVLQNKDGKLGFYKVAADNKQEILLFRAYLKIETKEAANMPASLSINFDDEPFDGTTGISEVEKSEKVPNGRRYNLSGVEVSDQYKGIVIVDGKKYIIK